VSFASSTAKPMLIAMMVYSAMGKKHATVKVVPANREVVTPAHHHTYAVKTLTSVLYLLSLLT
jgi:hypothetical protein